MFYQFKPARAGNRIRSGSRTTPVKSLLLISKLSGKARAYGSQYPGIGKLIVVAALALIGSVIAGLLFYQGLSHTQQTVFKVDLSKTLLGERITIPRGVAKQRALDLYLDSLDRAITADSIGNLKTQKLLDHADAQLH